MKRLLFSLLCLYTLIWAAPIQDRKIDPLALMHLAAVLGAPAGADIIAYTQQHWLRKPTQERWELSEITPDQRSFVLNWAKEQGLFADWTPALTLYDTALILGATTSRMQMRLDYLKKLWNEGVRFREIAWLTGDRPLDKRVDGLTERCSSESEAAHILWKETDLPKDMRHLPTHFVAVPMKGEGPSRTRPNTEDTIIAWLQKAPASGNLLFVSDQPFCGYQFAIVKAALPESFSFDLVGKGVDPSSHPAAAAITLDSIARWIYTESLSKRTP